MPVVGFLVADERENSVPADRPTILATSMGFNRARNPWRPYSNAVHYGERRELFQQCIASGILPDGYANDAGAGLHYEGTDLVPAIADRKHAGAYRVTRRSVDGGVSEEPLEVTYLRW